MKTRGYPLRLHRALLCVVFLLGLLSGPRTAFPGSEAVSYAFISMDVPDAAGKLGSTVLNDIGNHGQLLAGFVTESPGQLLIHRSYTLTNVECPGPGVIFTAARKLNTFGEIVGGCQDPNGTHAFIRSRAGTYTLLDVPGAIFTQGTGINDHRQVVGYFRDERGTHGFLWKGGRFLTIDVPGQSFPVTTIAQGINNRGQIVGTFSNADCGCGDQGFLLDKGTFTTLSVPDAQATIPTDINARSQIVGFYADGDFTHHGFLLDEGAFTTIDVPFFGAGFTEIEGINDGGVIVGRSLKR